MTLIIAVVVLAAGLGKRMKSPKAKVLHEVLGKPMVLHVVQTAWKVAGAVVVVVGNQAEEVRRVVSGSAEAAYALQDRQLGTGHAVMCALPHIPEACDPIVILCGDVPLVRAATLQALISDHRRHQRDVTLLAVDLEHPFGYGRVLLDTDGRLCGIVEEADADEAQRSIRTINSGIYCVSRRFLTDALPRLDRRNAQGEFYLTDIIRVGYDDGMAIGICRGADPDEILGINTPEDLRRVEAVMTARKADIS
jgi:bifunctional UDP-N-acetylglucosamine pyrophosphorylase/glucosamine-1-phosphate N-acetyltransferase/UDP-N-acetylglucosamine pyrophosphorylase